MKRVGTVGYSHWPTRKDTRGRVMDVRIYMQTFEYNTRVYLFIHLAAAS